MSLDIVVSDHILLGLCYKLCRPFVFPLEYRKQRWCIVYVCPYLNMLALFCGIGLCIWGLISIGATKMLVFYLWMCFNVDSETITPSNKVTSGQA